MALNFYKNDTKGYTTFKSLFEALKNSEVSSLCIPVENSRVGAFQSLDLIQKYDFKIVGQFESLESQWICTPGVPIDQITQIYAHPYVLDQCQEWLDTLQNVTVIQSSDSAHSCAMIRDGGLKNCAVIASPDCGRLYGLTPLASVADVKQTLTRYYLVAKQVSATYPRYILLTQVISSHLRYTILTQVITSHIRYTITKVTWPNTDQEISVERHQDPSTLLVVSLKNVVSAITRATACFSHRDINISKIESMPSTRAIQASKPWEYVLHLQIDAGMDDKKMQCAVANLEVLQADFRWLELN
jgi:prephenate dehydratase